MNNPHHFNWQMDPIPEQDLYNDLVIEVLTWNICQDKTCVMEKNIT